MMPVVFFGHGSPMNALQANRYTEAWKRIGAEMPRPKAIVCVSAHWYVRGTAVTAMDRPRTIHDFYGFPQALFDVQYPAPGDPVLAERVRQLLLPLAVSRDTEWGLDHGAWQVLLHAFPKADVPVVQLAIDASRPPAFHYELGRRLAPLREEGVLICGSGNVVHNLPLMQWKLGPVGFDWAHRFNDQVRELMLTREHQPLIDYTELGPDAALSVPTPEHYLPLLYCLGLQSDKDEAEIAVDGLELGAISMLSVLIRPKPAVQAL